MKAATFWRCLALALALGSVAAHAGGPLGVCNQAPLKYSSNSVTLNYDGGGNLGSRTNSEADAIVAAAAARWSNVSTATITIGRGPDLPVDVTAANFAAYLNSFDDGINPVIYDTDGTIVDAIFGVGNRNSVLGFAGSASFGAPTCRYAEGRAVINGFIAISDNTMTNVIAHELGHLIGMDHTQLDSSQGLAGSNYPLMYPTAFRTLQTLHDDDISAVSALYPEASVSTAYGALAGRFRTVGGAAVRGANLWARNLADQKVYSVVSDYLTQGTGHFSMLVPPGMYTLHAEAVASDHDGGSSVGPYADDSSGLSFQSPMYTGGTPMSPLTFGNGSPIQVQISAGCVADVDFRFNGTGAVGGNCPTAPPQQLTVVKAGTSSSGTVSSSPGGINCGSTCSAPFQQGAVVTLTATPVVGTSTFAGWSGACTGTGTCTVTMDVAKSVTATFNQDNGVAVSAAQLIFGTSQSTQSVTFTNNTGVRITFIQASTGSARFGQTNNCGEVAAGASCTAMVTYYPTNTGPDTGILVLTSTSSVGSHGVALYAANAQTPRLVNISTRMQALTGADVMIGGFIIQGSTPKTVVVRARGPSLAQFGIYNNLANPQLQLFSGPTQIAYNNDWGTAANAVALQASGFAPSLPQEAAILTTLAPGAYSAIVSGVAGGTGVSIIEVFEVDHPENPLANISTRGQVRTGADAMIGGFIIQGNAAKTVVVRARGPSLTAAGVPGVLANPVLQLVRSADGATIAVNDNWGTSANAAQLASSGFAPSDALESAILMTLQPGAYTAIVTGVGGGTGVAIVEVFAQ